MKNPALWRHIQSVKFDAEGTLFTFVDRLSRDNDWSSLQATDVLNEYKRFCYLAAIADRELTPSEAVDQVWHQHLIYSKHYWGPWRKVLGIDLHHGPSPGGSEASAKYLDNYQATLALYVAEFGETPPDRIWPNAQARFARQPIKNHVDLRYNKIVKRIDLKMLGYGLALLGFTLLLVALWTGLSASFSRLVLVLQTIGLIGCGIWIVQAARNPFRRKKDNGIYGGCGASGCGPTTTSGGEASGCGGGCGG